MILSFASGLCLVVGNSVVIKIILVYMQVCDRESPNRNEASSDADRHHTQLSVVSFSEM